LAFAIERVLYLNLATSNTKKLLTMLNKHSKAAVLKQPKMFAAATRGPVASIFYQGLDRFDHGIEVVEKSIISYGGVQAGCLKKV
jgi:biopolymer transport protein ExbB